MATELVPRLPIDALGGARVFRPCSVDGRLRRRGDVLTVEDLRRVRPVNLRALIDQRYLVVWPAAAEPLPAPEDPGEVFVYPRPGATNRFDVIVGVRENGGPLTKSEAEQLAARLRKGLEPATAVA